ncbi:biotin--[acetyl-CoA-carboxylase] ligase [Eikenella glucosivorans]|nr:biotin--[acetyl-CoA-carboxylase] ligase [Eikenella glucosivorans]
MMQDIHWQLLAALADGRSHHVTELARRIGLKPPQLNALWQQVPPHIRGLLRQQDGRWRLVRPLAILDEAVLQRQAQDAGWQAELLHEHPSSNSYLIAQAKEQGINIHRRIVFIHHQTQGRGRQGRSWQSRIGECLMFSAGWCFARPPAELGGLTLAAALVCCRALRGLGVPAQIKWPNDLVIGGEKLGGILTETVRRNGQTAIVVGIGINFVQPKAVEAAEAVQGSAPHASVARLTERLLPDLAAAFEQFDREGLAPFLDGYHACHRDQNQPVQLLRDGQTLLQGTALGVDKGGALHILDADGVEHSIVSGEISLRPLHSRTAPAAKPAGSKMLLLDAGNSKLKWAWVENGRMVEVDKAAYWNLEPLGHSWRQHGGANVRIIGSAVCGAAKQQAVAEQLGREPEWLGSMPQALGIRNHYRRVNEHGADRWFNILGSRLFTPHACVVVSCGTAVTIDALTADNHYLGGNIMPGFNLMKEAMAQHTANLNRPAGRPYPFGTTTANAIAGGMIDAVCGAVMLMHERLRQKQPDAPTAVILTGGGAAKIKQGLPEKFALDNPIQIVDNLVLHGLLNWAVQT